MANDKERGGFKSYYPKRNWTVQSRYSVSCVAVIFMRRVSVCFVVGFKGSTRKSLRGAHIVSRTPSSIVVGLLQKRGQRTENGLPGFKDK